MADDYREIPVPPGHLAEVVTYVEMRSPPTEAPPPGPWRFERRARPDVDWYLGLYREIGEEWLWYSRLMMARAAVEEILADPAVEVFALTRDGRDVGLGELSFREPGEVEVSFFGVARSEFGAGAGRWLMAKLLERAWRDRPGRVWLHTCTFDHPAALRFYLARGFRAYKRTIGIYADPRLGGVVSAESNGHVPIIAPNAGEDGSKSVC